MKKVFYLIIILSILIVVYLILRRLPKFGSLLNLPIFKPWEYMKKFFSGAKETVQTVSQTVEFAQAHDELVADIQKQAKENLKTDRIFIETVYVYAQKCPSWMDRWLNTCDKLVKTYKRHFTEDQRHFKNRILNDLQNFGFGIDDISELIVKDLFRGEQSIDPHIYFGGGGDDR